jgi:hypothetical protein
MAYKIFSIEADLNKTTSTVNRKLKGLTPKRQKQIDTTLDALSKDFTEALGNIDINDNIEALGGLPAFSKLLQDSPETVASASAGISLTQILDLISSFNNGAGTSLDFLNIINSKNTPALAGGALIYKIIQNLTKNKGQNIKPEEDLNTPSLKQLSEGRKLPSWQSIG